MSATRTVPDGVRSRQIAASDPSVSAWVSANAGSGKTHVLAQRVIRLLLQDFDPARILCITFTKAAAANMANRVFDTLRHWTTLDDAALDQAIRLISDETPGAAMRARARRLFALVLETPGGLKVQTIHAFCTNLLHLFPFEANVAARFEVMDETAEAQLLDQLTLQVLLEAAASPHSALGRALSAAISAAADTTFRDIVREAIGERDRLCAWIEAAGSVDGAVAQLSQALGIDPADSEERIVREMFGASDIPPSEWDAVAAALAGGQKTDVEQAKRFASLKRLSEPERLDVYLQIFYTNKLMPRQLIVTQTIGKAHPALLQRLLAERDRVCDLVARRRAVVARDRTAALVTIAHAVIARFRAEKDRRALLDYDDLIDRTLALLENVSSAWVHYKLDRGIDHVLIDEAQDTSPKQWAVVRALTAEFFAGEGVPRRKRTIFAVGDEKQSIFSFQGAAPREFAEMRRYFERAHARAALSFIVSEFKHSFRSGPNVLGAVDCVFAQVEAHAGLTADRVAPVHEALPDAAPGLVEIWDTEKPADKRAIEGWDAPFDTVSETSPAVRLAERIARSVAAWLRQGYRAGDVLVLVRRRGVLFEAIIRALKNRGVPVAGADRLVLTEHIAVMDLIALADALLLAEDDLALATVLKSPLFGLDDAALFALAHGRKGSLRARLREQRPDLADRLDALACAARERSPFAFYADLLGAGGGRKAFFARLGHEAADALDEFLNLALDYERSETPSLQGFAAWLRAARSEVKRDMEMARDEVRVMTVHGAKGLEAPIVVLADTTTPPQGWHPPRLLALAPPGGAPNDPACLVWAGRKEVDVGPMTAAREAALSAAGDEYRRLLYVAMTRASERLIVCGIDGERKRPDGCWYDLVSTALAPVAREEPADDGEGMVLRYRKTTDHHVPVQAAAATPAAAEREPDRPSWLTRKLAAALPSSAPITPSRLRDEGGTVQPPFASAARARARDRGTAIHRLLQSLPELAPERRREAALRHLSRSLPDFSESERADIVQGVLALLDDARFSALFAPGSRAEVSIAGRIADTPVFGQIDRLAVTPDSVLIADYKTNRPAPRSLEETQARHSSYISQLALYRAVLMRLYPDRPVDAALVWTEVPALMPIPGALLDAVCARSLTIP